jgi:imidazolonepropionase-like amidohydrolase
VIQGRLGGVCPGMMILLTSLLTSLLSACSQAPAPLDSLPDAGEDPGEHFALLGGIIAGVGPADLEIRDGVIAAVGEVDPSLTAYDVSGRWLAPAFIDSHVHFAYLDGPEPMADGGVAAAVDLAAPEALLSTDLSPLAVLASGPMVTAVGGYPTQSWGAGGYGLECGDAQAAAAAVAHLAEAGAGVIKLPVTGAPSLEEDALRAAVEAAHGLGLKVASHALGADEAALAAAVGADVLAHTPTDGGLDAADWSGRAVISTLAAFGGSDQAIANLAALQAAGATVLYGTDYGNTRTPGVDPSEIALLQAAGLDGAAILEAGTAAPAALWGFDHLGALEVGRAASLLVLEEDPLTAPETLAAPAEVWIDGRRR